MGRKLLKTVQTITTFRNPLADPMGTRRGPQFENRWSREKSQFQLYTPPLSKWFEVHAQLLLKIE